MPFTFSSKKLMNVREYRQGQSRISIRDFPAGSYRALHLLLGLLIYTQPFLGNNDTLIAVAVYYGCNVRIQKDARF